MKMQAVEHYSFRKVRIALSHLDTLLMLPHFLFSKGAGTMGLHFQVLHWHRQKEVKGRVELPEQLFSGKKSKNR